MLCYSFQSTEARRNESMIRTAVDDALAARTGRLSPASNVSTHRLLNEANTPRTRSQPMGPPPNLPRGKPMPGPPKLISKVPGQVIRGKRSVEDTMTEETNRSVPPVGNLWDLPPSKHIRTTNICRVSDQAAFLEAALTLARVREGSCAAPKVTPSTSPKQALRQGEGLALPPPPFYLSKGPHLRTTKSIS